MHLFVYGTLRRDVGHPMHGPLRESAQLVGSARARGILYSIDEQYPGLVLDAAAGWVVGELYRLRDLGVLVPLDEYEGTGEPDPEFRRVRGSVRSGDGSDREAWIYEYAGSVRGRSVIASGDYLRRGR